ncbi:LptA/OstA family protein [Cerasicoccus fimbriatus]|uniref:LptA/OstA family protein n=1 Tax=Cerasicoccus fimbriatus TaxID=3014554 RepID=UPI0022B593BE|nr:LptA/OstA family protein [Cerasicoccus sp. TK19100]
MKHFIQTLALLALLATQAFGQQATTELPAQNTVITSDNLELVGGDSENRFFFTGNVKITGTNMLATCDEMEVIAARSGSTEKTVGEMGAIESIIMMGNVVIEQSGRKATGGRAEILPNDDKVILSEGPRVEDSRGVVSGWKMILHKGERKVEVLSDPNATGESGRTRVQLPGFKDLGYDDPETSFRNPGSNSQ